MNYPSVPLRTLDELWFQIAGTLCNLQCTHCFISCSPENDAFGHIDKATVRRSLEESKTEGVKEYYFTGGEPFLHREMIPILEMTLDFGPATVLTNGTIMTEPMVRELARIERSSIYSLEFRVSIDHFEEERNDEIRGRGSFRRALKGAERLAKAGFLPIITAMRTWDIDDDLNAIQAFGKVLVEYGIDRPRFKLLPSLKIGAERKRSGGYGKTERITREMMDDFPDDTLICTHSRIVSDRGVHVCPILIDAPDSLLGRTLAESKRDFTLAHQACYTCYMFGSICSNMSSAATETTTAR